MSKMDALNQKTVLRMFRALKNVDLGLNTDEELINFLHDLQSEYFDEMIRILEGHIDE